MRLILHIGTHKTGTSSLQLFCRDNRKALLENGVFYPKMSNNAKNFNFLGARASDDDVVQAIEFFEINAKKASRAGVNTILISAESLYAMTGFFYCLNSSQLVDYWEREEKSVANVRKFIPDFMDISIYCYIRRQDNYLEAIYNQCVKHEIGITDDINKFYKRMENILDYSRHFDIWYKVFGNNRLFVNSYECIEEKIENHFFNWALGIDNTDCFHKQKHLLNERLSRDILEYKRILNRVPHSRADAASLMLQIMEINKQLGANDSYWTCLSPEDKKLILDKLDVSNKNLQNKFPDENLGLLMTDNEENATWEEYTGLNINAVIEILYHHLKISRKPSNIIVTRLRRIYYALRQRSPLLNKLFNFIRLFIFKLER